MSKDNGRHVRGAAHVPGYDLPPRLEPSAVCCPGSLYDHEHDQGRIDGEDIPISIEGARRQVYERELELAYARGVLAEKEEPSKRCIPLARPSAETRT